MSLSEASQFKVIKAFNSTSRYLVDLLNIDNNYTSELQLNKAVSDTEVSFLELFLSISDVFSRLKFKINEVILILILIL